MVQLLALSLLLGTVPGERDGDQEEPVGFLLTADLGSRMDRVHCGVDQCALLRMN